ncbi:7765_t:CDS:2 [Ambispora leptoticha]|uniref:7765_t:CDS:1 n=1 Tax=Ambispora leptoticha TaxID=144679 RepID=A0A9N9FJS3_9GLOM|nr:7765_t:CDS:2 [Ambispora leptoticha]
MLYYKICEPNQYMVTTGAMIKDVKISKKGWVLPSQRYQFFDITPVNYTLDLTVMSAEKLEFNLPAVFTIGPKDDGESLIRYARLLAAKDTKSDQIIRGIIAGETRSIAAAMTMEEIFLERKQFKQHVIENVQAELDQFGLHIYNCNVKQLQDSPGSEYFKYMRMKTHEGAVNSAKVDVAEARYRGDVGAKEREGKTRCENAQIEADTIAIENELKAVIAEAEMNLSTKKSEFERKTKIAAIERDQAAKIRQSELQKEVETLRMASETERLRVAMVAKAQAEKEASNTGADSLLYTKQKAAEAELVKRQKESEGLLSLYNAQADGVENLMSAFGDASSAVQYIMIERGLFAQLAKENAEAVRGLNPQITVWNTAGQGTANNPVANLIQNLPPLLSTIQDQTGISPPSWLADMSKTTS